MGCHSLFQGLFLTRGWNPRLVHWLEDSLPLGHVGSHSYPAPVSKDGSVVGPQSRQSCRCSQRRHRRTHRHTHTDTHTHTHTLWETPRPLVVQRASPLEGGGLDSPLRSPFGGPPLSPGASSMVGARMRRGPRFESLSSLGSLSPAPASRWLSQPGQGTES